MTTPLVSSMHAGESGLPLPPQTATGLMDPILNCSHACVP